MTKIKTHSGASKRFKKNGSGLKRKRAGKSHILTKRTTKNKRQLRGTVLISKSDQRKVVRMLKTSSGKKR